MPSNKHMEADARFSQHPLVSACYRLSWLAHPAFYPERPSYPPHSSSGPYITATLAMTVPWPISPRPPLLVGGSSPLPPALSSHGRPSLCVSTLDSSNGALSLSLAMLSLISVNKLPQPLRGNHASPTPVSFFIQKHLQVPSLLLIFSQKLSQQAPR